MSDTLARERIDELRQLYDEVELQALQLGTAAEKAKDNVNKVIALSKGFGGFVAYFVVGESFHEDQHEEFCNEMGIGNDVHNRTYPLETGIDYVTVLQRELQVHPDSESVHGMFYHVKYIPYDRD